MVYMTDEQDTYIQIDRSCHAQMDPTMLCAMICLIWTGIKHVIE